MELPGPVSGGGLERIGSRDEHDFAGDAAGFGVAERGRGVDERVLAGDLWSDGAIGQQRQDTGQVVRQLSPVATWAQASSRPKIEEVRVPAVGQRVPGEQPSEELDDR